MFKQIDKKIIAILRNFYCLTGPMIIFSDLGHLMYLRIWHDNSGKSKAASWYLNHIIIRDIQTDKKYFFISNKWFAVEEDDGQVCC